MKRLRTLILGLDGITWDVLTGDILTGYMPNLKALLDGGVGGVLESTLPAVTPAAWTTCTSGCNPCTHGLIDFHQYSFSDNCYYYTNSDVEKVPSMWHYLGESGYRVASINVPFTFPVYPVNGIMIAGLGCPSQSSEFVYPNSFKEELLKAIPNYEPGLGSDLVDKNNNVFGGDEKIFRAGINKLAGRFDQRLQAALLIQEKQPVDIMMVQFQQLDLLQHLCWPFISAQSRDRFRWQRDIIFELYRHLDNIIGQLIPLVDRENGLVAVASDHGFGPLYYSINLNRLLLDWGYLHRGGPIRRMLRRTRRNWMKLRGRSLQRIPLSLKQPIDPSKTRAMVLFNPTIGILHLNVKGRQQGGCVNPGEEYQQLVGELKTRFGEVVNPDNGEKIFEKILIPDELWGPGKADPEIYGDLVLIQKKGYQIETTMKAGAPAFSQLDPNSLTISWHYPEGIFVLNGRGFRRNLKLHAHIADIAPTVYTWLGMPIPAEVDGEPIRDAFLEPPNVRKLSQVNYPPSFISKGNNQTGMLKKEEEVLAEQLKNLGYM